MHNKFLRQVVRSSVMIFALGTLCLAWPVNIQELVLKTAAAEAAAAKTAVVTGKYVNLRGGPGTNYPVKGRVNKGDKLPVLGQKGDWYKVKSGGQAVWLAGWLVRVESTPVVIKKTAVVTAAGVNLRKGPGTSYPVSGRVNKGDRLPVIGKQGGWCQVRKSDGQPAWVAGWLVRIEGTPVPVSETAKPAENNVRQRKEVVITATDVNIRSGPGTGYKILDRVDAGARYRWLGSSGRWYKLEIDGSEGWVANWLAKIEEVKVPSGSLPSRGDGDRGKTPSAGDMVSWLPSDEEPPVDENKQDTDQDKDKDGSNYELTGIEVDKEKDKTVITVEANTVLKYNSFMLNNPNRLVINFEGVKLGELPELKKINSETVIRYRTGQFSEDPVISRLVLDLAGPVYYRLNTSDHGRVLHIETYRTNYDQFVEGKLIFIDPGHGGTEPGTLGYSRSIYEKDINLDIALRLAAILKQQGARVEMSRVNDATVGLYQRTEMANKINADIFISIHSNANSNPEIRGTSVYFYAPSHRAELHEQLADRRRLARDIQTELVQQLKIPDKGVRQDNLAVLRTSAMPSVLVETAYLSNPEEERMLQDSSFRQKAAEAIARGINAYFAGR
ncbi:N-acetylmuramoyl-L-alanine amidase [Desulfohalotomaculum tongense]|uniref:N-acetylmuramoyl-L-alanine amidase n=1 Tax=Desulforadius tongensis TaxID=1216062 RepID=UPI0019567895|nr:N-acetylmuramoyl-L-alanine amidase [Desulforadius tongensis]MBM7855452.1 N-acetylmuramoyl-L-alanine amidase [Desulforadius tongensis]